MKLFDEIQKAVGEEEIRMEAVREEASIAKAEEDAKRDNPDIDGIIRNLPAFLERAALDGCHTGIRTFNVMVLSEKYHLIITDSIRKKAQERANSEMGQVTADILLESGVGIRDVLQESVIPLIDYLESEGFEVSIRSQDKDDPGAYCPTIENYISVSW
ncbi:hypothetical protein KAT63_02430 [Candidatus Parcubacteria bacterium]|nr:hypothetical protein [Candidatus Parcubacteria bacterium]